MTENAIIIAASMFAVAFICLAAALGAALGNGNLTGKAIESMARQPEEAGKLFTNALIFGALAEALALIGFVLTFIF